MARLRDAGAAVLNQAVLLRGVNDSVDALADLSERGFAAGVLPYYLHQLDRVDGAAHFEVPAARALELHAALVARLDRNSLGSGKSCAVRVDLGGCRCIK